MPPAGGFCGPRCVSIAVDAQNQVYITGTTLAANFPTTAGAFQTRCRTDTSGNCFDAFVTKLNAQGNGLVYSTFLGGTGADVALAIAVDTSGRAVVTGRTQSTSFPITLFSAAQTSCTTGIEGCLDLFVTQLNATGNGLRYSTYLGGSFDDVGVSVALDLVGQIYITGWTWSSDYPTKNAYQATTGQYGAAIVTRFDPAASGTNSLVFSTYLGGSTNSSSGLGIAVDSSGVYVTGTTGATNFPVLPAGSAYQTTKRGLYDAFITKLTSSGASLLYSTYLGGSGNDSGLDITLVGDNPVITGETTSPDLRTAQAIQVGCAQNNGGICSQDAFVMQLNGAGTALVSGTYLGGTGNDAGLKIVGDGQGQLFVTGRTESTDFPTASPQQGQLRGPSDAFIARFGNFTPPASPVTSRTVSYSYDGLQRLTGATERPGKSYAYGYDRAGNRTTETVNGVLLANRTYDNANQVIGWSYDAAGNLLSDLSTTYSYDPLSRLTSTTRAGTTTTNSYNGDGTLVSQLTGSTTTRYTQDLAAPLAQILQTQGASTVSHLYGRDRLLTLSGATRTWYASDALGSVRQVLSDAGLPQTSTTYDPWGRVSGGSAPAPFGFTGELQDAAGLTYLRARWYNPAVGTFTAVDPFKGFPEIPYSQHLYQYAYANPILYVDPSGLCIGQCPPTLGPVPATPTSTPIAIHEGSGQGGTKSGGVVVGAPYTGDTIRLPQLPQLPRAPSGGAGRVGPGILGLAGAAVGIVAYLNYCLSTIDPALPSGPAPVPLSGPTTNQGNVLSLYHILTPGRIARFQQGGLYISADGNRGPGLYLTPSFKDALFWGIRLGVQAGSEQVLRFDVDINELGNLSSIVEDGTEFALYALEGRAIQNNLGLRRGFPSDPQQYSQVMGRGGSSFAPYDYVAGGAARGFEYAFKSARSLDVLKRANTVLLNSKGSIIKSIKFP